VKLASNLKTHRMAIAGQYTINNFLDHQGMAAGQQ
jgi:hypothetical protein